MRLHTTSVLFIAALAVQGGVVPRNVPDYIWDVTQYQAGLSHGNPASPVTSWYAFTVSGVDHGSPGSTDYIPAFGARCTGSGAGIPLSSDYSECALDTEISEAGASVSARVVPDADSSMAHIAISYTFSNGYVEYKMISVPRRWERLENKDVDVN
ncbi:hypothetical protein SAMD00023353_0104640 [Rosellinia necatrix]|uniref:Uncharacterized protein n=1 Tax=Rosellinia necatrix TaxID=77044 RepID=A0A1S7UI82_ROSNE|nr:hypothetical protein SAMD00023353_0104640 [Rosellinia necatrix]